MELRRFLTKGVFVFSGILITVTTVRICPLLVLASTDSTLSSSCGHQASLLHRPDIVDTGSKCGTLASVFLPR